MHSDMERTASKADLLATDRCDRCGAQAHLRAVMDNGELLFCKHHGRVHGAVLDRDALYVEVGRDA